MSTRELVVLGTASQQPTRRRNHNGYVLRWDGNAILFDPGEGTQRQMTLAEVSPSSINRICLTHFHGDHCLGLPGVLLRMSLDRIEHHIDLHYPASGEEVLQRLRNSSIGHDAVEVRCAPVHAPGVVAQTDSYTLTSAVLDHRIDAIGWRVEEPPGRRVIPERAAALGLSGPEVGQLKAEGRLETDERTVGLAEISEVRRSQSMAVVMDTRWCDGALELADGVDLLLCESTFLEADADLAREAGHLTARQAGLLAAEAGARLLVLTHFSSRYPDDQAYLAEAMTEFDAVILAEDLTRIPLPRIPLPRRD
jgi:ribonuclease Z